MTLDEKDRARIATALRGNALRLRYDMGSVLAGGKFTELTIAEANSAKDRMRSEAAELDRLAALFEGDVTVTIVDVL